MSAGSSTLGHAVAACRARWPQPGVLRRTSVAAGALIRVLNPPRSSSTLTRCTLAVGMAPAATPVPTIGVRVLRRVRVTVPATPGAGRASSLVLGVRDRFQAVERVATQDPQTRVQVVELQTVRDRAAEVLPHGAVYGDVAAVVPALADVAVAGTTHRAGPYPVAIDVVDVIENAVDEGTACVDPGHAPTIRPTRAVSPTAGRHALFAAVHNCRYPDPLSARSRSPR